jgi:ABC-type nickel/cobalt efflux system permease component RcnA
MMFGLDDRIASFSSGTTIGVVIVVALVLGLRHATDPDHLAAVTTLLASGKERAARSAARLGFVWGLGHATSLFVFGLPIVLYRAYLPEQVQRDAETAVGVMIVVLALMLLNRWRLGRFHVQVHEHDGDRHSHGARTPLQAYTIGLVHGIGGSAGVGVLLLASIPSHALAIFCLGVFAFFTAVSMSVLSSGFGLTLSRPRVRRSFGQLAPALGVISLAFGVWYMLGSQSLVPYVF